MLYYSYELRKQTSYILTIYDMNTNERLSELFTECWNNASIDEKISISNIYDTEELSGDNEIFANDENFFNTFFENNPMEAVRSVYFGKYNLNDPYVWFNGYRNLESTEWEDELPLHDVDELFEWYVNNTPNITYIDAMKDFIEAVENGFTD